MTRAITPKPVRVLEQTPPSRPPETRPVVCEARWRADPDGERTLVGLRRLIFERSGGASCAQ